MKPEELFRAVENLVKRHGSLSVSHDAGGSGMGLFFCSSVGGKWPFCSGETLADALTQLASEHARIEREALERRITEIDASANL